MEHKTHLFSVISALEQSIRSLEARSEARPEGRAPEPAIMHIHARRRRFAAMLRAMLRWYGVDGPKPAELSVVYQAVGMHGSLDRRLISVYEAAIEATDPQAPEYRLLVEQCAEAVEAYRILSRPAELTEETGVELETKPARKRARREFSVPMAWTRVASQRA